MAFAGLTLPGSRVLNYGNPVNPLAPLNRGLVGWWLNLPSRGKGNTVFDLCGKYHGTLTNGPTWSGALGRPGGFGAVTFDGSNDYITLGVAPAALKFTAISPFSISAWVRPVVLVGMAFTGVVRRTR
jgi:hypothetical protein